MNILKKSLILFLTLGLQVSLFAPEQTVEAAFDSYQQDSLDTDEDLSQEDSSGRGLEKAAFITSAGLSTVVLPVLSYYLMKQKAGLSNRNALLGSGILSAGTLASLAAWYISRVGADETASQLKKTIVPVAVSATIPALFLMEQHLQGSSSGPQSSFLKTLYTTLFGEGIISNLIVEQLVKNKILPMITALELFFQGYESQTKKRIRRSHRIFSLLKEASKELKDFNKPCSYKEPSFMKKLWAKISGKRLVVPPSQFSDYRYRIAKLRKLMVELCSLIMKDPELKSIEINLFLNALEQFEVCSEIFNSQDFKNAIRGTQTLGDAAAKLIGFYVRQNVAPSFFSEMMKKALSWTMIKSIEFAPTSLVKSWV